MDIVELRIRIDELDRQLVELLNERARAAQSIGRLKRHTSMPIYEPDRERAVFQNIARYNRGPLREQDLQVIYQALIAVMREIQSHEILDATENDQ
ncbi:MAG TPA: chorismate mutase [Terriglobales bacterium]|nr:chorismate mutase [Terriglobales bacterium]